MIETFVEPITHWQDFKSFNFLDLFYQKPKEYGLSFQFQKRGRNEESNISIEYLEQLHNLHEEWLDNETTPVHVIDTDVALEDLETDIRLETDCGQ